MNFLEQRRQQLESALPILRNMIGDAAPSPGGLSFLVSELAFVEARVYEKKYAPLLYQRLLTISTEGGPGVTSFVFRTMDFVGQGKRISSRADDIPYAEAAMGQVVVPAALGGVAYHYNTEELRQSAMLRIPLPSWKARAAMKAYENHMNKVALVGEDNDLNGIINYPNVPVVAPTHAPWTSSSLYSDIMADVNALLAAVYLANLQNVFANTLCIPPTVWTIWSSIYIPQTGVPLLQLIQESNFTTISGGGPLQILQIPNLETAGATANRRLIAYNRDAENLVMHIPMPLTFLPPQPVNLDLKIPGEYKYGGVEIRYLNTIRYMDGV